MLLFLKLVFQVLAIGTTILVSVLDYVNRDKRTKKFKSARKALFAFLLIFLIVGVLATIGDSRQAAEKENELRGRLEKVESQNDKLQRTVTDLSEDQRKRFGNVLDEQQRVGTETAIRIKGSADILHTGIEDSLSLLNKSAREINRATNPISDMTITFQLSTALETASGSSYRDRVEKAISDLSNQPDGLWAMGTVMGDVERIGITKQPYTPDKNKEPAVYYAINFVSLTIAFYKQPLAVKTLIRNQLRPDLGIRIRGALDNTIPTLDYYRGSGVYLSYELKKRRFTLTGANLLPVPYAQQNTGKIVSIPDLSGAQMVISVQSMSILDDSNINSGVEEINKAIDISSLTIRMSGGREFTVARSNLSGEVDQNGHRFYVRTLPQRL